MQYQWVSDYRHGRSVGFGNPHVLHGFVLTFYWNTDLFLFFLFFHVLLHSPPFKLGLLDFKKKSTSSSSSFSSSCFPLPPSPVSYLSIRMVCKCNMFWQVCKPVCAYIQFRKKKQLFTSIDPHPFLHYWILNRQARHGSSGGLRPKWSIRGTQYYWVLNRHARHGSSGGLWPK